MRRALFVVAPLSLAFASIPALAQPKGVLACEGIFARTSSHAQIVKALGERNVVFRIVPGPEGTKNRATVIYPNDKVRRVEILWHDEKKRQRPINISVKLQSSWKTPHGIGIHTTLQEVEKINGRPFKLAGFSWDYSGTVLNWNGGALDKPVGGCNLTLRFGPTAKKYDGGIDGDGEFSSDLPAMRAAKPTVYEISIGYGE
jgi:hypothetical protein